MKTKVTITAFLITVILASCSSRTTSVPIATTLPTASITITPTATLLPVSPTPQVINPSPITFSGEGNAYITVNKWRGPALIHLTYTGSDDFIAWNVNEKDSLLEFVLHLNSDYSGTQVLDISDQRSFQTHYLEIHANGNWTVEILPFEYGRKVKVPSVFTGKNNDVVFSKEVSHLPLKLTLMSRDTILVCQDMVTMDLYQSLMESRHIMEQSKSPKM